MPRAPDGKRFADVMHAIIRDIANQHLAPGDRLPVEVELMRRYRVSRAPLREALRLLEAQGLITIRSGPGGGPGVARPRIESFGRTVALHLRLLGATCDDLRDARVSIGALLAQQDGDRLLEFILRAVDSVVAGRFLGGDGSG